MMMFYLGLNNILFGSLGLLMFGTPSVPGLRDWALSVVISVIGMAQMFLVFWALQVDLYRISKLNFPFLKAGISHKSYHGASN